jgi:peroxiredoxin (alkyl hydroperoxide reductase subunit C)
MNLMIGKSAPHFKAGAIVKGNIVDDFSLDSFLGKYVVFFFYPLNFTFVCPTELHAFQDKNQEFESRGAQVVGCSVDSVYSHFAWLNTPQSKGGIEGVSYPLVSDLRKTIASDYQVLKEDQGIAYRGLFILDKQGVIRHQLVNDLPLGRSVDEALRVIDALIQYENFGEVCPANWQTGAKTMKPSQEGLKTYFSAVK